MCAMTFHARRGFTLIEILVVVVILGMVSAIIVPQIGSRDDMRASASARVLVADLIYAQNMAITKQASYYVQFGDQQYKLVTAPNGSPIIHPVEKSSYLARFGANGSQGMRGVTLVSATFVGQSGVTSSILGFDDLGTPLVFTGVGSEPMTSGSVLVQCGPHRLRVNVIPFTGEIEVVKG